METSENLSWSWIPYSQLTPPFWVFFELLPITIAFSVTFWLYSFSFPFHVFFNPASSNNALSVFLWTFLWNTSFWRWDSRHNSVTEDLSFFPSKLFVVVSDFWSGTIHLSNIHPDSCRQSWNLLDSSTYFLLTVSAESLLCPRSFLFLHAHFTASTSISSVLPTDGQPASMLRGVSHYFQRQRPMRTTSS